MRTDKTSKVDWPAVKAEYLGTSKAIREIARAFRISDTAIRKKAKVDKWGGRPAKSSQREPDPIAASVTPLVAASAADAEAIAGRGRNLINRLMEELEALGEPAILDLIKQAIVDETKEDLNKRRRTLMLKAVSFPTRAAAIKNLAGALRALLEAATGGKGKKERAREAAAALGAGGDLGDDGWGDLLTPGSAPN